MASAQPKELAASLGEAVDAFFFSITHIGTYDKFKYARLMRECDALQKSDVVLASLFKALLASSIGEEDEMRRWHANAELNGGADKVLIERLRHFVNHGYGTPALALVPQALEQTAGMPLMAIAKMVASVGAFHAIVQAVEDSQARGEVLHMTQLFEVARRAKAVMDLLGVSDADVAAMMDVAGGYLRTEKLLWQQSCIDIGVLNAGEGGPALSLAYRIDVSPEQAARMGWALAEDLVRLGLDCPGISVDFLGTALAQSRAA